MENSAEAIESRIMEAAISSIGKLCIGKWKNLEYQDRVSEACLIFLEDLRTMPLNTGHFLEDYRADLDVKMRELNKRTPSPRFAYCSLDSLYSGKTGEFFEGYRFISSPLTDFSIIEVMDFLGSLPTWSRKILVLHLEGFEASETAEMLSISITQLDQEMKEIQRLYRSWIKNGTVT